MQPLTGKLWNKSFILMMIINTITYIGFVLIIPILPKYIVSLGGTTTFVGITTGAFALTALFFRPFTGQVADWFNKRKLMMLMLFIISLITLGYGFSKNIYAILVLRILNGVFFSFFSTVCGSLGVTYVPEDKVGQGVGYLGIGMIVATAFGPNIGTYIINNFGYNAAFYASFSIIIISILMLFFLKDSQTTENIVIKRKLSFMPHNLFAKELIVPVILVGFGALMNGVISNFILLYGDERNIKNISLFFLVNAVFVLITRLTAGKILDKRGLSYVIYPAYILIIASALLMGFSHSLWLVLIAAVFYGLGQGASQPSLQAYCIKELGPKRIGLATSSYYFGIDLVQGFGPILSGIVIDRLGYTTLFCAVAVVLLGGIALFWSYSKRKAAEVIKDNV